MFDHLLRGVKDRLLAPLATIFRGVAPNVLTLTAFVFGIAAALAAWRGAWLAGLLLWGLNRITDGLDGTVARVAERQTDFGGYLDILLDFIVYAAIPVGFAIQSADRGVLVWTAVLEATFFVNACSWMYLSAVLEKRASGARVTGELTTVTMPPALVAGFETVVFFGLFFVFPAHLVTLFGAMSVLVGINVIQRLIWARHVL
ncbi:MAG: CDP-alcohol phosphatidyltransferase family protein [Gemmatimonadaceae bacterium]|nr:CDP-alcohol phosphatidyltransferase family protein [Gemmatimonadaceae bacterium]